MVNTPSHPPPNQPAGTKPPDPSKTPDAAAANTPPPSQAYAAETRPLPPVGSRDYVAGQPVDEEEQKKVDGEHAAKLKAADEAARKAEAEHASKK
jgi:hypothetical protein